MEYRGQEGTRTPVALGYNCQLPQDSSAGEERRRSDGNNNNGNSVIFSSHSQPLDHHHDQKKQLNIEQQQPPLGKVKVLDSGSARAVTGEAIAPNSGRSKLKKLARSSSSIRYRECLKNHAASIGGSVVDGCGEFMPNGEDGTLEALTCAACNCHRNFHRQESDHGETLQFRRSMVHSLQLPPPLQSPTSLLPHQKLTIAPPMTVAYGGRFGGGGEGNESSSEEINLIQMDEAMMAPAQHPSYALSPNKRFRTKFTAEQKNRMLEFAEKIGWRIQKQYEEEMEKFCAEVGVKRQVLKVWMHNNKNSMKKQQHHQDQEHDDDQQQEQPL